MNIYNHRRLLETVRDTETFTAGTLARECDLTVEETSLWLCIFSFSEHPLVTLEKCENIVDSEGKVVGNVFTYRKRKDFHKNARLPEQLAKEYHVLVQIPPQGEC
ncbi:hypothetical protein KTR10_02015 [Candidatus Kaiserbacteria bacterium]|nr:hypothetical protein [Candidatus Kaiserbacteria bacterium]